ncbi:HlyC/CorC family transporter [Rhodovulum sp. DZ06]|uniref:HlyC/CorC family transporter n=1 Tax=Rhodovulum sp. DZ06 TaxID=3425126 RepID=UPI003D340A27
MTPDDAATAATAALDATVFWTGGAILLLLMLSAFFSGSETALTASSRAKLHGLADKGDERAATALRLTEDGERLIGAILLGNNLVNILAASLATSLFTALFGESGVALATLVMTVLVLVFAEVTPKTYAITTPEAAATRVARPISLVVRVLAPVVAAVGAFVRLLLRAVGVKADPDARVLAHEEIKGAIDLHHSEGAVEKDDRDRLLAALDLRHREVSEVMAHRSVIESVDVDLPPREILAFCLASTYTRIPVWKDEPENIVGVLHAKDLLRAVQKVNETEGWEGIDHLSVAEIAMEPWFVPDTTSLDDQMRAFLQRRSHFALVVDEYGDLQGLLTLEDILEEIVGDIADEHDAQVEGMERESDGSVSADGWMTIRDLNRACDWSLPDEEANTLAGLVIHEAQAIPSAGQIFSFHGFRFEVLERKRNQITKLRVKRLEE